MMNFVSCVHVYKRKRKGEGAIIKIVSSSHSSFNETWNFNFLTIEREVNVCLSSDNCAFVLVPQEKILNFSQHLSSTMRLFEMLNVHI